jgi:hypothetical protein
MKNVCLTLVCGLLILNASAPAFAIPAFKKAFDDNYASNAEVKKSSDELKCNLCHFGKSKKNRNDYGRALGEYLKKANFTDDRVKAEGDKVKKEYEEAFKKVEGMKATDGTTFGDRIKAGKAPGTPETE